MKVEQFKYINSQQFINSSLISLMKNLKDNHLITSQHFKKLGYIDKQIILVYHKDVYPYDYINSHDHFKEIKLLLFHKFHSQLKDKIT